MKLMLYSSSEAEFIRRLDELERRALDAMRAARGPQEMNHEHR